MIDDDVRADLEGLEEKELRDLIERAHLIESLTQHEGWPVFRDYLIALTVSTQRRVLEGRIPDMESYRWEVGRIEGIKLALNAPSTLMRKVVRMQEQADENSAVVTES